MVEFDLFISYSSADRAEVEQMARALQAKGLKVFFDRWNLTPGLDWRRRLEEVLGSTRAVAICLGAEMGGWQHREYSLAFDRQTESLRTGQAFPVIPVLLSSCQEPPSGFLRQNTWVDLRGVQQRDELIDAIVQAIHGRIGSAQGGGGAQLGGNSGATGVGAAMSSGAAVATGEAVDSFCPYRGLRYFREEDAPSYFGREASITQLLEVVKHRDAVAVLGASGTGKSSLVRAGLIPRLRRSATNTWEFCTVLPGHRPLRELAAAIVALLQYEQDDISLLQQVSRTEQGLRDGSLDLPALVKLVLSKQRGTDRLLLFVDQWEEIYSPQCADTDRQIFIRNILEARSDQVAKLLITIRADFFERAITDSRDFSDAIQGGIFALAPQSEAELLDSIVKPAAALGVPFEPGLPERLLADARQQPGSLPLVEFVLEQLWSHRAGQQALTHASYQQIGGLSGAITAKAEELWASLTPPQQDLLKKAFIKLITPGTHSTDTRRRASLDEFLTDTHTVLNKLVRGRLLTVANADPVSSTTIEIAHEALINCWNRLKVWIEDDRAFAAWHVGAATLADRWKSSKKYPGYTLRNKDLKIARKWLKLRQEDISPLVLIYVRASWRRYIWTISIYVAVFTIPFTLLVMSSIVYIDRNRKINDQEETGMIIKNIINDEIVPHLLSRGDMEFAAHIANLLDSIKASDPLIKYFNRDFEFARANDHIENYVRYSEQGKANDAYLAIHQSTQIVERDNREFKEDARNINRLAESYVHLGFASAELERHDESLVWCKKASDLINKTQPQVKIEETLRAKIQFCIAGSAIAVEDFLLALDSSEKSLAAITDTSDQEELKPHFLLQQAYANIQLGEISDAERLIADAEILISGISGTDSLGDILALVKAAYQIMDRKLETGKEALVRIGEKIGREALDNATPKSAASLRSASFALDMVCRLLIEAKEHRSCSRLTELRYQIIDRMIDRNMDTNRAPINNLLIDLADIALVTLDLKRIIDKLVGRVGEEDTIQLHNPGTSPFQRVHNADKIALLHGRFARLQLKAKHHQSSIESSEKSVTNARESFVKQANPKRASNLALALEIRAEVRLATGQSAAANADYSEALEIYRDLLRRMPKRQYLLDRIAAIELSASRISTTSKN